MSIKDTMISAVKKHSDARWELAELIYLAWTTGVYRQDGSADLDEFAESIGITGQESLFMVRVCQSMEGRIAPVKTFIRSLPWSMAKVIWRIPIDYDELPQWRDRANGPFKDFRNFAAIQGQKMKSISSDV